MNTLTDNEAKKYLAAAAEDVPEHYTEEQWVDMLARYKALRPATRTGRRRAVRFETELGRDGSWGVRQIVSWEDPVPVLTVNNPKHPDDAFWAYPPAGEDGELLASTPDRDLATYEQWRKNSARSGLGMLYPAIFAAKDKKGDQGSGNDKNAARR